MEGSGGGGGGNVMCAACFHMAASVDDLEDHFDVCPKRALLDKDSDNESKKRKSPDPFDRLRGQERKCPHCGFVGSDANAVRVHVNRFHAKAPYSGNYSRNLQNSNSSVKRKQSFGEVRTFPAATPQQHKQQQQSPHQSMGRNLPNNGSRVMNMNKEAMRFQEVRQKTSESKPAPPPPQPVQGKKCLYCPYVERDPSKSLLVHVARTHFAKCPHCTYTGIKLEEHVRKVHPTKAAYGPKPAKIPRTEPPVQAAQNQQQRLQSAIANRQQQQQQAKPQESRQLQMQRLQQQQKQLQQQQRPQQPHLIALATGRQQQQRPQQQPQRQQQKPPRTTELDISSSSGEGGEDEAVTCMDCFYEAKSMAELESHWENCGDDKPPPTTAPARAPQPQSAQQPQLIPLNAARQQQQQHKQQQMQPNEYKYTVIQQEMQQKQQLQQKAPVPPPVKTRVRNSTDCPEFVLNLLDVCHPTRILTSMGHPNFFDVNVPQIFL